jgi:glycosyltransferase involved in cell wall biosynthesis
VDVTIVIGTFGGVEWMNLARERAFPSAQAQGVPVIHRHGNDLAQARNHGLALVQTEWVIHLDADDELEPGYVEAMEAGTADVRGPLARYVDGARERLWQPRVFNHDHDCTAECLRDGNWLLIGSAVRTDIIRAAGGWRDFPWSEDWSTWLRCWKQGATFELIPDAVYRAHVRHDSRNRGASAEVKQAAHEAIYRDAFPEEIAA